MPELETTAEGYRLRPLGRRGADWTWPDIIVIDDPLKPEEALRRTQRQSANEWFDHASTVA